LNWRIKSFFIIEAVLWVFCGAGIFVLVSTLQYFMYALSVNERIWCKKKFRRRVILNYVFCYLIIAVDLE
jgi:ABC-type sugar transport system permease subunit